MNTDLIIVDGTQNSYYIFKLVRSRSKNNEPHVIIFQQSNKLQQSEIAK